MQGYFLPPFKPSSLAELARCRVVGGEQLETGGSSLSVLLELILGYHILCLKMQDSRCMNV